MTHTKPKVAGMLPSCQPTQSSSGQCSRCEWVMMKPLVVLTFSYLRELPWLLHHTLHNLCLCLSTPAYKERDITDSTHKHTQTCGRTQQYLKMWHTSSELSICRVGMCCYSWMAPLFKWSTCFDTRWRADNKRGILVLWVCAVCERGQCWSVLNPEPMLPRHHLILSCPVLSLFLETHAPS